MAKKLLQLNHGGAFTESTILGRYNSLITAIETDNIKNVRTWLHKNTSQINEIGVLYVIMKCLCKKNKNIQTILNLIIKHGISIESIIKQKKNNYLLLLSIFVKLNNNGLAERLIAICKDQGLDIKLLVNTPVIQLPPLFYAKQNIDIIKLLLKNGADPNYLSTNCKCSFLYGQIIAKIPNVEIIQLLLENGANANGAALQDNSGSYEPMLNYAIQKIEDNRIANLLIDYGANIHVRPSAINSALPLYTAVQSNKLEIVSKLLLLGADPNIEEIISDNHQYPLSIAIEYNYTDVALLLINSNANINQFMYIVTTNKQITPLCAAIIKNNVAIVQSLLEKGADHSLKTTIDDIIILPLELAYILKDKIKIDTEPYQNYINIITLLENAGAKRYICNNIDCNNEATNKCSKCEMAHYCSKKCQISHWKTFHKLNCNDFSTKKLSF